MTTIEDVQEESQNLVILSKVYQHLEASLKLMEYDKIELTITDTLSAELRYRKYMDQIEISVYHDSKLIEIVRLSTDFVRSLIADIGEHLSS